MPTRKPQTARKASTPTDADTNPESADPADAETSMPQEPAGPSAQGSGGTRQIKPVDQGWTFVPIPTPAAPATADADSGRRRGNTRNTVKADTADDAWPSFLPPKDFEILEEGELRRESPAGRRSADSVTAGTVQVTAAVHAEERVILMARQPSGAISFHLPLARPNRRAANATAADAQGITVAFQVPVSPTPVATGRRGWLSNFVRVILVKVADFAIGWAVDKLAELTVPFLARELEKQLWKSRTLGWLRVTEAGLAEADDKLAATKPSFTHPQRGLLFLHGTFSTTHGSFRSLAGRGFFKEIQTLYGSNIFGFNHFSISATPMENVRDLLDALPDSAADLEFDVITHSRGGLVARELLELSGTQHPKRQKLKIHRVIMVACPCAGTPLGSPSHWEEKLAFMANLLELLPDNPFSTAGAWIAESLKWIAGNVLGHCHGLTAMDPAGGYIEELQSPPGPPQGALYHALVANFQPPGAWQNRLADMAVDSFFGVANDLVVPTEGGWRIGASLAESVAPERIACYGPGGNLRPDLGGFVHHGNFFEQPDTIAFLTAALKGQPRTIPIFDPTVSYAERAARGARRGAQGETAVPMDMPPPSGTDKLIPSAVMKSAVADAMKDAGLAFSGWDDPDTLYITAISSVRHDQFAEDMPSTLLLAQYGSARVAQPLYTRNTKGDAISTDVWTEQDRSTAGSRFRDIIAMQIFMHDYTNNKNKGPFELKVDGIEKKFRAPTEEFLRILGARLFNVLFTGDIRRLYDAVQHRDERKRVSIIFTSMLPWLSDLPWELAYDPGNDNFLSTSNVRFLRNVLTPIPADRITRKAAKLRILVASAQAIGASPISDEQETQRIRDSFRELTDQGLVEVDVIVRCTPELLHSYLRCGDGLTEYDVFHFIGHGYFDKDEGGFVEFVNESGDACPISDKELASILRSRGIRIVFLNACETGAGFSSGDKRDANFNKGVAIELAKQGIPAVVANQYSVADKMASLFSLHFYSCLAHGLNIADATREARIAVSYSDESEDMDWGVPVLFARNPNATLCARRPFNLANARRVASAAPDAAGRRGASFLRGQYKVAVWCTSPALSYTERLSAVLHELNERQNEFHFMLRERRIPAYLWKADMSLGFLRANSIIQPMEELRRDTFKSAILFCLTDLPLMNDTTTALYYFSAKTVVLFSTWDLDPPLQGPTFKSALANHLAIGILEQLADIRGAEASADPNHPIHTLGYFNDERSVDHISGPMTITPETLLQIKDAIKGKRLTRSQFDAVKVLLDLDKPQAT